MYKGPHVKYPFFWSHCIENLSLSTDFRKIPKYQISLKSVQWGPTSCYMWDGQTDERTEGWRDNQRDRCDKPNSRL
jgi:hypothetical protein